jgi:ubiquinone/menaquinone biosynthesis C-methylase UbiE
MAELTFQFDDGTAYERFMGRWSRAAGRLFLDWLAPPAGVQWLDVGCGTGILTELVLDTYSPAAVFAIDSADAQIDFAQRGLAAGHANFQLADAQALPFDDAMFDIVISALVLNFIPDRRRALSEMRRVARAGAVVAGFVWAFDEELSPTWPLRRGMRQLGRDVPSFPGSMESGLDALHALFEGAGLGTIVTRPIEVTVQFQDFEEFWEAQTPRFSPLTQMIEKMTEASQAKLIEAVRTGLPVRSTGGVEYTARANAVRAYVPG